MVCFFSDGNDFVNREFSFTLENDIYVRYQSFDNQDSFEEGIKKARPIKIDIGAIFSHKASLFCNLMCIVSQKLINYVDCGRHVVSKCSIC